MKGLIMKDFYTMIRTIKIYLFIVVVYVIVFGIMDGNAYSGIFISTLIVSMAPVTAIAYDEQSKWDKMAGTMPVTPKDIVLSKYVFGFLLSASAAIFSSIIIYCFDKYSFNYNPSMRLYAAGSAILLAMLYHSILFPTIYRFGTTRGRAYTLLIMLIPAAIAAVISLFGFWTSAIIIMLTEYSQLCVAVAILISIGIYIGSAMLSIKIYKNKEF